MNPLDKYIEEIGLAHASVVSDVINKLLGQNNLNPDNLQGHKVFIEKARDGDEYATLWKPIGRVRIPKVFIANKKP